MAGERPAHCQCAGGTDGVCSGSRPADEQPVPSRLGHALDATGHFRRRIGFEPDTLRLPHDPHHRFLFRRPHGRAKPESGQAGFSWAVLFDGACTDQFHPGGSGRAYRRAHGSHAAKSRLFFSSIAGILIFFATSLFGLWELRLPGALTQMAGKSHTGYFGSLFMGLTLGVVAAPCIGPFVLGLLTWVAGIGSAWLGFLVFFVLSLGLGLPLFVLALFSGQLQRLPRAGGWMLWVRKLMGWVLVGMAVYFIRPILPDAFEDAAAFRRRPGRRVASGVAG